MENLFINSMSSDTIAKINAIKKNKKFALLLIEHLSKVYQIFESVKDQEKNVLVEMRRNENNLPTAFFSANKDGVTFSISVLGYYEASSNPTWSIGELYERYIADGTKPKRSKTFVKGDHSEVEFKIKLYEGDSGLANRLRDIMYLLDKLQYNKKF